MSEHELEHLDALYEFHINKTPPYVLVRYEYERLLERYEWLLRSENTELARYMENLLEQLEHHQGFNRVRIVKQMQRSAPWFGESIMEEWNK